MTALIDAVKENDMRAVKELLECGAAVDEKSGLAGFTALMQAACFERAEIVRLLLEYGADISEKTKFGGTALTMAGDSNRLETARLLVGLGAVLEEGDMARYPAIAEMQQNHAHIVGKRQWLKQKARNRPIMLL